MSIMGVEQINCGCRMAISPKLSFNVLANPPFFKFSTCFFTRPRRFSYFDVSIDAARLRTDFPFSRLIFIKLANAENVSQCQKVTANTDKKRKRQKINLILTALLRTEYMRSGWCDWRIYHGKLWIVERGRRQYEGTKRAYEQHCVTDGIITYYITLHGMPSFWLNGV